MRYEVRIQFLRQWGEPLRVWNWVETTKTLREANQYRDMVDETVSKAEVFDTVTKKIVETWK